MAPTFKISEQGFNRLEMSSVIIYNSDTRAKTDSVATDVVQTGRWYAKGRDPLV